MKSDKKIAIMVTAILVISVFAFAFVTPVSAYNGGWYLKPGYDNYAPSGMPDFDQKQDQWQRINCGPDGAINSTVIGDDIIVGNPFPFQQWIVPGPNCTLDSTLNTSSDDVLQWSFCGPVAVANCFWWFDSKFEKETTGWPGDGNDTFPLVQDYGAGDDHNFSNVPLLVEQLAQNMSTCAKGRTNVPDMVKAIDNWLNATGLNDTLYVHTIAEPTFTQIQEEINQSQDVILLLSFVVESGSGVERIGRHYVTCAGVNASESKIAVSDPYFDNKASGNGPGRMVPDPHPGGYTSTFHNDARNISHDFYNVTFFQIGSGWYWGLPDYPINSTLVQNFAERNWWPPIYTIIKYAVVISPKPSIEVVKTVWNPETGKWVKELNASINDTLRFNCTIHNNGDFNLNDIRFWDILDCSLNYSGNATLDDGGIVLYGDYVFKPKVLHPDNSSWVLSNPYYEDFTELCPEAGISREIEDLVDHDKDGNVSACDQIQLSSEILYWYHVDRVPYTLNLSNEAGTKYFDSVLNWDKVDLNDPNGTEWLEVCCCKDRYNLSAWYDTNSTGDLNVNDTLVLRNKRTGAEAKYTVEEVTKDLVVSKEWKIDELLNPNPNGLILEPCQTITIEYNATVVRCGVDNNTFVAKGKYEGNWTYSNEDVVTITVPCPSGEATDAAGGTKDVYYTNEIVYATGSGFAPNSLVNIYITEDKKWEDGMTINSTIYATKTVLTDANGNITAEEMWPNPRPGEYDMVFDANRNGFNDVGIDAVDHPNHPGFTVLGQVPALMPIGIAALVGLLAIIATSVIVRKRKKR